MMTVGEIMKCEIPEGKYYFGLVELKLNVDHHREILTLNLRDGRKYYEHQLNSFCASFSALYALANGEYIHADDIGKRDQMFYSMGKEDAEKVGCDGYSISTVVDERNKAYKNGCQKTMADVLDVIKKIYSEYGDL